MKAKEIVAAMQASADVIETAAQLLKQLLTESVDTAMTYDRKESQVGSFRQGFQAWRGACATLTAKDPVKFPEELQDLFPSLLCDYSIALFALCLEQRAFLGFTPAPDQAQAILDYIRKCAVEQHARQDTQSRKFLEDFFNNRMRQSIQASFR